MIKAVIFDLDGLLIDSEPLWRIAEKEAAKLVGIDLTEAQWLATMAFKPNEVVDWWQRNIKAWESPSPKEVEEHLVERLIALVGEQGAPKAGALAILEMMKKKTVKLALASSSPMRIIDAAVEKIGIRDFFDEIYSAESEEHGKPNPGVFLTTAQKLGVRPEECLVFEDSLAGLSAAKSAGMKCVSVPEEALRGDERLSIADEILNSLEDFNEESWERLNG